MKLVLTAFLTLLALASCSTTDDTGRGTADRTVTVTMRDNHFEPDELEVQRGETVLFHFVNRGSNRHDAFIGNADAQEDHEREARTADSDEHGTGHSGGTDAITLEPGGRDDLSYTFADRGDVLIGCHEPGHYADGMKVTISVK